MLYIYQITEAIENKMTGVGSTWDYILEKNLTNSVK